MSSHDIRSFATGMSARLASRSRHVNLFLGAGSSKAAGLPDVAELQAAVEAKLSGDDADRLRNVMMGGNLETGLSRMRRIVALLGAGDQIDGMDAQQAKDLDSAVCGAIVEVLSDETGRKLEPAANLAAWLIRADYSRPVDVFTVNYDLLIEQALDALGAPYFDGFGGLLAGRFRSDLVDADGSDTLAIPSFFTRLWKLHGSLNWSMVDGSVVRLGSPVSGGAAVAIYPSDAKYDESRRVPFVVLQDRFRRALNEPESLTLLSGYSWGDAHLNDQIYDAAARRPRSEIVAFCFSKIPDALAAAAQTTPNLQVISPKEAILGAERAAWVQTGAQIPEYIWKSDLCQLGDFASFAMFLARGSSRDPEPVAVP